MMDPGSVERAHPRRVQWGGASRIQTDKLNEACPPRSLFCPSPAAVAAVGVNVLDTLS